MSLLDRLKELSAELEDALDMSSAKRDFYRFHQIKWDQPGIPINRNDLHWLPATYRENPAEYPLYQFTISTALGRVAGFHDETGVFQIVLLDPQHNLQPVKRFDYRVDANWPLANRYEQILMNVRTALNVGGCADPHCPALSNLKRLDADFQPRGVVYISDELIADAEDLRTAGKIKSFEELFELNVIEKA